MKERGNMHLWAPVVAAFFLFAAPGGCAGSGMVHGTERGDGGEEGPVHSLPFSTVDQGVFSGIQERAQRVIGGAEEWKVLWASRSSAIPSPLPPPPINFSREMVIAVSMGEQRTGGYSIEIQKIEEGRYSLEVLVSEAFPLPGALVAQVLTQPYHIIKVERRELPVRFRIVRTSTLSPSNGS